MARPAGGYLLAGTTDLVTVNSRGTVSKAAIPAGSITQAPTATTDDWLLAPRGNDDNPDSRSIAATGLTLWHDGDSTVGPKLDVADVERSSDGLALLRSTVGTWSVLQADGSVRLIGAADGESLDPDATLAVIARSESCPAATALGCGVRLIRLADSVVLASALRSPESAMRWNEQAVAYTVTDGAATSVVILSPDGVVVTPVAQS